MRYNAIYRPLTATPFKRNSFYMENPPSKELQSYIRCYWGTENPLIQIENDDVPELVIPDTCVDIIYHIDYTDNIVTGGFCGLNDCSFHAPEGKACPIYDCVRNNKCMQNCGECGEVPCKIWFDTRDPKFSDEEFNENIAMRVQVLKKE